MASSMTIAELEKAVKTLKEALQFAEATKNKDLEYKIARDACIQRYEYCIELSWKLSMKLLGSMTKAAKPAIREMARSDLIASAEVWLEFIDARNESSHSYDENVAKKVFSSIQKFSKEIEKLLTKLRDLE